MPDIFSGFSALKTAIDITKELRNATSAYSEAEMRLKLSDLYSALADTKTELADTQLEMIALRKKIEDLNEKLNASDDLEFRDPVYFRKVEIEGKPNGPFCPNCYEGPQKKLSTMSKVTGHFSSFGRYKCNTCNKYVK